MATVKTNIWDLKAGDKISFTNYAGHKREVTLIIKGILEGEFGWVK